MVKKSFHSLMQETAMILSEDKESVLQLHALNSWILAFRPIDHSFLCETNIFSILFKRMSSEPKQNITDKDYLKFELANREKLKSSGNSFTFGFDIDSDLYLLHFSSQIVYVVGCN